MAVTAESAAGGHAALQPKIPLPGERAGACQEWGDSCSVCSHTRCRPLLSRDVRAAETDFTHHTKISQVCNLATPCPASAQCASVQCAGFDVSVAMSGLGSQTGKACGSTTTTSPWSFSESDLCPDLGFFHRLSRGPEEFWLHFCLVFLQAFFLPTSLILARPQGRCPIWEGEHLERCNLNAKALFF